ncbi:hypothetical protein [Micromonospora inyonensis]|uniref:Uncharacterized protein n=1 Tax=Micromonospora inyonensis TaxID=47866 RepID=A0A1C6RWZ4_9ACTN|nr:hypothetical protein [Micromonospora inyonensis]SCL21509.1 hypothetical protein GA0074694_3056 [Micromonospora inyonensis]SCL21732.1 hypothetical protein GA0074694_3128 [Micromonospora inyonensis]
MAGETSIYGLPYLEPDDPPDIAGATQDLAEAVETELQRIESTPQPVDAHQAANDTTSSQAYQPGTTHGTAFTAPPSGRVYITVSASLGTNAVTSVAGSLLAFEVRIGSSVGSGTVAVTADDTRAAGPWRPNNSDVGYKYSPAERRTLVPGLTPGGAYNVRSLFRSDTSGATAAVLNRYVLVEPSP